VSPFGLANTYAKNLTQKNQMKNKKLTPYKRANLHPSSMNSPALQLTPKREISTPRLSLSGYDLRALLLAPNRNMEGVSGHRIQPSCIDSKERRVLEFPSLLDESNSFEQTFSLKRKRLSETKEDVEKLTSDTSGGKEFRPISSNDESIS
jgi:hypothetical protein